MDTAELIETFEGLADAMRHLHEVAEETLEDCDDETAFAIYSNVAEIKSIAADLAVVAVEQVCKGRKNGERNEYGGLVSEVKWSTRQVKWRQDALRQDVRPLILVDHETGELRSGAEVLDLLWSADGGLQPLNGAMRRSVLKEQYGVDVDEYAETVFKPGLRVVAAE